MSKRNRPRRDILEDLETQGRVADVILLAWGIVEMTFNVATLAAYGLSSQDPKSRPLLELSLYDKLSLLKRLGKLPEKDFQAIDAFRKERNDLFHVGGIFLPNFTDEEKSKLTDLAISAADASHDLLDRIYGRQENEQPPWTDPE